MRHLEKSRVSLPEVGWRHDEAAVLRQDGGGRGVLVAGGNPVGPQTLVVHVRPAAIKKDAVINHRRHEPQRLPRVDV